MARSMVVNPTEKGTPQWAGDFGSRDHLVPGPFKLDPARFRSTDTVVVNVGAAGALINATTVPVDALPGALPAEAVIYFSGTKYARLSAAAAAGATSIAVYALPQALVDADVGTWLGTSSEIIHVPAGTLVSRTIAERDAGTGYGPFRDTDPASETFILFFDTGSRRDWDAEMYRPNSQVFETYLPGWAALSATAKAMVRSRYISTLATD